MKEKYENKIPNSGERFSYVVVKGSSLYDENGKKQPRRVADYMEFSDIAKELNIEIDIGYYLKKLWDYVPTLLMMIKDTNCLHHIILCRLKIQMREKSKLMRIPRTRQKKMA